MFTLHNNDTVQNAVTGATWPTSLSAGTPTIRALEILAQTVDEDFLVLLPEASVRPDHPPKYILQAYVACFPSGFNTRTKLGLRLAEIHGPVPGYEEKLERSMDRFFARVEVGRAVKRVNWTLTTGTELFAAFGSVHGYSGGEEEQPIKPGELNLDQVCLVDPRCRACSDMWMCRLFCAVSDRRCIDCRGLRLLCLLFILIPILSGRSKMRDLGRNWRRLLTG